MGNPERKKNLIPRKSSKVSEKRTEPPLDGADDDFEGWVRARERARERERERKKARELSGESEIERKLDLLSDPTCRNRCGCGREGGGEKDGSCFSSSCRPGKLKIFVNNKK